ncbi:Gamma-aminobutyric acid receptor alpha-like [Lamellibrachia satsuma]|nr:Gamma-aminobutyric acid receptor alpha-like [Lamellibrachia satsuma]
MGEFSVLYVNFALRRHTGYFLINIYVPCSLLVVLSWVGFWINREATSDRIALGITVVLTMTFIGLDNRVDIPRVPYATALDHFLAVCFILISAVIVESAAVNYFTKYSTCDTPSSDDETEDDCWSDNDKKFGSTRNSLARMDKSNGQPVVTLRLDGVARQKSSDGCCNKLWNCLKGSHSYRRELRRRGDPDRTNSVSQLDTVSRIVFPFVFGIFQIIYWTLYFGSLKGNITSTRSTY